MCIRFLFPAFPRRVALEDWGRKQKCGEKEEQSCVGRESNPGQLLGRQLCSPLYHQRWMKGSWPSSSANRKPWDCVSVLPGRMAGSTPGFSDVSDCSHPSRTEMVQEQDQGHRHPRAVAKAFCPQPEAAACARATFPMPERLQLMHRPHFYILVLSEGIRKMLFQA